MEDLEQLTIRKAAAQDIDAIYRLLAEYAKDKLLLGRSPEDIGYHLDNFVVAEASGRFAGCCALRYFGGDLYEVRSLAVCKELAGKWIGSRIIRFLVDQMRQRQQPCRIFALTYHPRLFVRQGFHPVSKELFPPKIWFDCSNCPKYDHCDEEAVMLELE